MSYCDTCNEYKWPPGPGHQCDPVWVCEVETDGPFSVHAEDADLAAEKAAERWWEDDPPDSGDTVSVTVKDGDATRTFKVTADMSLVVSAEEDS